MKAVSPNEAFNLCKEGAIILDIREDYLSAYKQFNVDFVLFVPKSKLQENLKSIPKGQLLIIADTSGIYSREVCDDLSLKGYNVCCLAGGFVECEREGFPISINQKERLSGSCMCQLKAKE